MDLALADGSDAPSAQASATLTVVLMGTGIGTVTSSPAGLSCTGSFGLTCTGSFPVGTTVTLTQAGSGTHRFTGWGGACTGINGCTVAPTSDRLVVAGFRNPPSEWITSCARWGGSLRLLTEDKESRRARRI